VLNFINKRTILQLILAVIMLAWAGYTLFTQMTILPADGQTLLYHRIFSLWEESTLGCKIIVFLMLLLETFFVQRFYTLNKFSDNNTYLPAAIFLTLVNVSGAMYTFTPAWFTTFFLTFILIYIARDHNVKPVKNRILASGAVIAIATLLDFHAVWLVFFMICALAVNQFAKFKDVLILFAGALLVYTYVFTFHFLRDSLHEWSLSYAHYHFFDIITNIKTLGVVNYVLAGFLLISIFYIATTLKLFYDSKLIILRKHFGIINLLTFSVVAMLLFSGLEFNHGLLYLIVPLSLYYSMLGNLKRRKILHDVLFIGLIVLLCL